jgi:hypothetical protein
MRVPFSCTLLAFVAVGVLDASCFDKSEWNLNVVLVCISCMARDGKHFFHVLF